MAASKPTSWLFRAFPHRLPLNLSLGTLVAVWVVSLLTTDVSTRCLSPEEPLDGILSLPWVGKLL